MTSDCIEAMNEAFMVCVSKLPEDRLEWAANKVEIGYCVERRDVVEHCMEEWGRLHGAPPDAAKL